MPHICRVAFESYIGKSVSAGASECRGFVVKTLGKVLVNGFLRDFDAVALPEKIDNKMFSYFKVILLAYYMYSPRESLRSVYTDLSLKPY